MTVEQNIGAFKRADRPKVSQRIRSIKLSPIDEVTKRSTFYQRNSTTTKLPTYE